MEKEAPAAAAPANSPALPLSSQRHLLVAADTWMPWFSIQESDDGSRSYTGIMWEARAKKAILLLFIFSLVLCAIPSTTRIPGRGAPVAEPEFHLRDCESAVGKYEKLIKGLLIKLWLL